MTEEKNQIKSQRVLLRCRECGRGMEVPYKSYIVDLGGCCGLELFDFCSKDCFEKNSRGNGRPISSDEGLETYLKK